MERRERVVGVVAIAGALKNSRAREWRWRLSIFRWRVAMMLVFLCALAAASVVRSQTTPALSTQLANQPALMVGTDWYPEQWPESRWEEDLKLMEAAHIRAVRLTEFAWSSMEPSEGKFEFGWLDRAIEMAAKHHMVVILGTPTGGPPAWLTSKYPETLRVDQDGRRAQHGARAHGSASSPKYRELCRRIAAEMGRHFGNNPNVVGWQIDNEYGYAFMSYDEGTRRQFQDWLAQKYKTLASLNEHWATAYWSQTYDAWSEIFFPQPEETNPGLLLEWKNFVTYTWTSYQQNQIEALRASVDPRQFITGNFMGFFEGFDHYTITKPLTFVSWDDYVGTGHLNAAENGLAHDLMRGLKHENFWVLETQPGAVNWAGVNNFLNRGETRVMAWQAVAHGADYIGYWQWRSALNGQEQYHGVLVGPDGTPVPLLEEVTQIASEFAKTEDGISRHIAEVGSCAAICVSKPVGDRLAKAQQELRSGCSVAGILPRAAGHFAVGGRGQSGTGAGGIQTGGGAGSECDFGGDGEAFAAIREEWRAPGAGAAFGNEG